MENNKAASNKTRIIMTYQQYAKRFPIRQARNTGRYGFERVYDCLDLSRCVYMSRQDAGRARKESYDYNEANPEPTTVAEYLGRSSRKHQASRLTEVMS